MRAVNKAAVVLHDHLERFDPYVLHVIDGFADFVKGSFCGFAESGCGLRGDFNGFGDRHGLGGCE